MLPCSKISFSVRKIAPWKKSAVSSLLEVPVLPAAGPLLWLGWRSSKAKIANFIIPTPRGDTVWPEGILHGRISPDPDFRHPSCPPPSAADRQFSPGQRIYR